MAAPEKTGEVGGVQELHPGPHEEGDEEVGISADGGAQASLGILYDYGGDDVFLGTGQGNASSRISYHSLPRCGGNFGFVVNYGGMDSYGSGAKGNSYNRRGSDGGFLIDRATHDEAEQVASSDSEAEPPAKDL